MKKFKRDELKHLMGGYYATVGPCDDYPGQSTYICGTRLDGNNCYADYCHCNGNPVADGCDILQEGTSLCN